MSVLLLVVSFLLCVGILRALLQSPVVKHFGDAPDHRKVHQGVIPRIGGGGIILAFLAAALLQWQIRLPYWPVLETRVFVELVLISLFLLLTGMLDDVRPIDFKLKFLFQFTLAACSS